MATFPDVIAEDEGIDAKVSLFLINKNNEDYFFPLKFHCGGHEFICLRDVFMPEAGGHDCFIDQLPIVSSKTSVLEIGSGTGMIICGLYLKHQQRISRIVATDINPQAVLNTKLNFEKHNIPGTVLLSDLFENISSDEKFDLIFWNMPFNLVPENQPLSILERAIADAGYQSVERFLREANNYVSENGKVILGFSPDIGNWEVLQERAIKHDKRVEIFFSDSVYCPPIRRKLRYQLLEVKND